MRIFSWQILRCNIKANGLKSCVFSFGLGRAEFIEFSHVISEIGSKTNTKILDIGSGHSLTPLLLSQEVVVLDIDKQSLLWQLERSKSIKKRTTNAVRASAELLPFRQGVFDAVTAISSLEHLPDDVDIAASSEISRVLAANGVAVISVPGSRSGKTTINQGNLIGIPRWAHLFKGTLLQSLFIIFEVDRAYNFLERRYSRDDVKRRLIPLSAKDAKIEGYGFGRRLGKIVSTAYPYSMVTLLDLILATRVRPVESFSSTESPNAGLMIASFRK